jgi:hypothetical protein
MTRYLLTCILALFFHTIVWGQTKESRPGSDLDKHGCRKSAGFTFSIIRNACVQLFEEKIQLNEVDPKGTSTSAATVIFSADTKKAEVFIPGSASGIILIRSCKEGNYVWRKGNVTLSKPKGYVLKKGKKIIFSE